MQAAFFAPLYCHMTSKLSTVKLFDSNHFIGNRQYQTK
jgi:hypothetical protein